MFSREIIEVGGTIPNLRRVIIVHPERHGLTTLHQFRGRFAHHGGVGYFDLFLPNFVKEDTLKRLNVLVQTTDGFKVSELDMQLREVGDLSQASSKQSGADDTFLFGRSVQLSTFDRAMDILENTKEGCPDNSGAKAQTGLWSHLSFRSWPPYDYGDFQSLLGKYGRRCSISSKGNCWDNVPGLKFLWPLVLS